MVLEAYEGAEPTFASSSRFAVELRQGATALHPHVYVTKSPDATLAQIHPPNFCALHGGCFCNRSISWVEFGQGDTDTTHVTVTRLDGERFTADTRALPLSAGVSLSLSASRQSLSLGIRGSASHLLLQHGDAPSCEAASSFANSLLIFTSGRDPPPATLDPDRTLEFAPGVHSLPGDGVLQLPARANTIVLRRGAWVEGRINVTRGATGPVAVLGHGVMEGSRFTYHGGEPADNLRFVEPQYDRPLLWDGPTLVHPLGHAAYAPPGSRFRRFRMLGWLYNEDGIWLGPNATLEASFIRTNDDAVRLFAGSLDGFRNTPQPPRGEVAAGARVRRVVVSQGFNGAVLQLGWESAGVRDVEISEVDVTGAEWYARPGNATHSPNDAVISLVRQQESRPGHATAASQAHGRVSSACFPSASQVSPQYDVHLAEHHSNISVSGVRVDTAVGSFLRLGLLGTSPASSVRGLRICNATLREPLRWLRTNQSAPPQPGGGFVVAQAPDAIVGVEISGVTVAGAPVVRDADWALLVAGDASVTYRARGHV